MTYSCTDKGGGVTKIYKNTTLQFAKRRTGKIYDFVKSPNIGI